MREKYQLRFDASTKQISQSLEIPNVLVYMPRFLAKGKLT